MTPKKFKEEYPQYSSLEGEELWNAMSSEIYQNSFKGDDVDSATRANIKSSTESYEFIIIDFGDEK